MITFFSNFRGLNVSEYCVECEVFTIISIDTLLVYDDIYCMQVYLDNCTNRIAGYLGAISLKLTRSYKCCIMI